MKKLSNTETELKKVLLIKKSVYLLRGGSYNTDFTTCVAVIKERLAIIFSKP